MNKRQRAYRKGLWAEYLVLVFMMLKGYWPVARRYKTPVGEIDLIVRKKDLYVFVEVKARRTMEEALESLPVQAQKRIMRAAEHFLSRQKKVLNPALRFDFFAVTGLFSVRHLDNAWQAPA